MIRKTKIMLAARFFALITAVSFTTFTGGMSTKGADIAFKDNNLKKVIQYSLGRPVEEDFPTELTENDVSSLSYLVVNEKEAWSLEGIQNLSNLTSVDIWGSNVSDLTPLRSLPKLDYLNICNSCVTDLTPLKGLTNLKTLHCEGLNLDDCSAVGSLENLEYLTLSNCNIKDLSFLKNLKNLKELSLTDNFIDDISVLSNFTSLRTLYLDNNEITDISPLANLSPIPNDVVSYKCISLSSNMIDLSADSKGTEVYKKLEDKGYLINCTPGKMDLHILSINNKRDKINNIIDKDDDLTIVYNKNIENLKGNFRAELYDNKADDPDKDKYTNLDYIIDGNVLKITMKNAFSKSDLDILCLVLQNGSQTENMELLQLSSSGEVRGDVDGDGDIDLDDLAEVSKDYNKNSKTAASWNIKEDINKDGVIDIYDLSKIAAKFN